MNVANRIKELRDLRGISSYRLAQLSNVSQSFISAIESGQKIPTITTLEKICKGLDVTMAEFFSPGEPKEEPEPLRTLMDQIRQLSPKQKEMLAYFLASIKHSSDP